MEIKQYISVSAKKAIIDATIASCLMDIDNVEVVDAVLKDLFFHKYVIEFYTDIEFTKDEDGNTVNLVEEYDEIVSSGVLDGVIDTIGSDYYRLIEALDSAIEYRLKSTNDVAGVVGKVGQKIIDMVSEFTQGISVEKVDEMKEVLSKFDFSQLEKIGGLLDGGNKKRKSTKASNSGAK